jgi:isopenicillin N synthase-like dioxygenase
MADQALIPVVDIGAFINKGDDAEACEAVARALHDCGCLVVKDPRVDATRNEAFLDLMESYFEQSDGVEDARPDLHYQVGVTPSGVEKARPRCDEASHLTDKPRSECPPLPDAKWRFFWRIGERPSTSKFEELNAPAVIPEGFPEWEQTMNAWGSSLVETATTVAEMAALGFGLERGAFSGKMRQAPHLLAPTGSDLKLLTEDEPPLKRKAHEVRLGTVLAGFHTDLNFLSVHGCVEINQASRRWRGGRRDDAARTRREILISTQVHGKSRFPGLTVWTRSGKAVAPKIPDGCLFLQAGQQFQHLTAGHVLAGFHEVVASGKTADAARTAKASGRSLWRVSSTCFAHIASDEVLEPLGRFATSDAAADFPPTLAGDQVKAELIAISLA